MSQDLLAELSGVSRNTIAIIETRKTYTLSSTLAKQLAGPLGSTVEYLQYGAESVDKFDPEVRLIALRLHNLPKSKRDKCLVAMNGLIDAL